MESPCSMLATCVQTDMLPYTGGSRFGAYYQTSMAHPHATTLVLALFRRVYISALLTVYIDGNSSNHLNWNTYKPVVILPYNVTASSINPQGTYFKTVDSCVAYANRVIKAAEGLEWLLLLEDDVWVCNRINPRLLTHDMNGQCIVKYKVDSWGDDAPGDCYGGCGGYVLRGSFLRNMHVDRGYIDDMLTKIGKSIASDELLSALFYRSNGTIGWTADYSEQMTSQPVIVHKVKDFYHSKVTCSAMDLI